jgi:thiamine biosynthesis lipoprotein
MKIARIVMGMPTTIEIVVAAEQSEGPALTAVFDYFSAVDARFSTYKLDSEISRINRREIAENAYSDEMCEVFALAEKTKRDTGGYFDITREGFIDPSGLVKGWAIQNATRLVEAMGYDNYFIDVGGDIQSRGTTWTVGIRSPFNRNEIVKIIRPAGRGIATSGTYIRGQHIYDPFEPDKKITDIVSLTVVGPDIYEADRYATAAFAMGKGGITFIERTPGLEGYAIDSAGIATMTSGFASLTV